MMFLFSCVRRARWAAAMVGVLLTGALPLCALDPGKSVFHFNVQNWTRQSGLPADKISAVTQTEDGYIWLGTQNGLVRFDGAKFEAVPITLPEARGADVSGLDRSRDGGLWFAIRESGFGYYDGRRFSAIPDERWTGASVAASQIVEAADGGVWTGTLMGIGRWMNGRGAETFFETNDWSVSTITEDPDGRLWIGTAERGVFYWENGRTEEIADAELKTLNVYGVVRDRGSNIWIGTNRGLRRYDAEGQLQAVELAALHITALLMDSQGALWIGTNGSGLGRYENGKVVFLTKLAGLGSDRITTLFEDREGSLWVGTVDGLSQLTDLKFPIYSVEMGIAPGGTHAVAASQAGGVWIGTGSGASYFDGRNGVTYSTEEVLLNPYVRRVFEARNGDVYIGDGSHHINVLSGGRLVRRFQTEEWVEAMAEDADGLVLGVGGRLMRLNGGQLEPYPFNPDQEPGLGWINNLLVAKDGALWVASNTGVARIQNGDTQRWLTGEGLASDRVYCIFEDSDGSIWAGLPAGLARIKDGRVASISENNGLHDARVYAIVADEHGYFWFSSGRGIFRVARKELHDVADEKTKQIRSEAFDGLESVKFTDRTDQGFSGCKSADGRIWFPNPHGVVMIDPAGFYTNKIPPPVHIQKVSVDGVEIDPQGLATLSVDAQRLEFSFAALSYVATNKVQLHYRLEGIDRDWIDSGGRRSVVYNTLAPGDYVFRVRASNADGVWNSEDATFAFTLPPPFYRTLWFYLLCGLCGGVTVFILFRWKVRRMEMRQKKLESENDILESKVRERTEELAYERDLLRTLLDNSPDSIYFKDVESRFIKVSQALATRLGKTSTAEVLGRTDADFFAAEHARQLLADEQEIMRTSRPLIGKVEQEIWPDGRSRTWCITSKLPLRNKNDEIVGTFGISKDITAIKESQAKLDEAHKQLLEISRQAGMAEIATGVLHNVGNVLNSVNVSATIVVDQMRSTKAVHVAKLAALLTEHKGHLPEFMTHDPRGRMIPDFLTTLAESLAEEQKSVATELEHLQKNVEHIKEIVAMQQAYARPSGVMEMIALVELVEDSLRINSGSLARHAVEVVREYGVRATITTDKHKVIQILINLIRNAEQACIESGRSEKRIIIRTTAGDGWVRVEVIDNGVGIVRENLTRIFNHGFTTRPNGHGFGLHSGALAAKEIGGALRAQSDGAGRGAIFTLELPFEGKTAKTDADESSEAHAPRMRNARESVSAGSWDF